VRLGDRWELGPRHIGDYMRRWLLCTPWFTLRLHKILRSDQDRDLHDHPWDFLSFILSGAYAELTPDGRERAFVPGDVNVKRAEDLHSLRLLNGDPVWTLVVTGPRRRRWGFATPSGWVHWREYHASAGQEGSD
jgi:hypothetical protein